MRRCVRLMSFFSPDADIGRHNALDKIYGHLLRQRISVRDKVLAFSGRVSSEVVLKAAKIGVGVLLSKSAPTDLALRLAHDLGITVVGFIRRDHLTVYTHPEQHCGMSIKLPFCGNIYIVSLSELC